MLINVYIELDDNVYVLHEIYKTYKLGFSMKIGHVMIC